MGKNKAEPKVIWAIRLSSMGDVAMLVPIFHLALTQHPEMIIYLVTDQAYVPLFPKNPRLRLYPFEKNGKHKGIKGIRTLAQDIRKGPSPSAILDFHSVLRSWLLKAFLLPFLIKWYSIQKGRWAKWRLTRRFFKKRVQVQSTFERYARLLTKAGFPIRLPKKGELFSPHEIPLHHLKDKAWTQQESLLPAHWNWEKSIGIAPFAKFTQKIWPLTKTQVLLEQLLDQGYHCILYGGGKKEEDVLKLWSSEHPNCFSMAGKTTLPNEIHSMAKIQLMLCMDSSNMHLASLCGTPTLSIWGATHPHAGFKPWNPANSVDIQIPTQKLPCRPCSVYGKKPCWRGDLACLEQLGVDQVSKAIQVKMKELRK